MGCLCDWKCRLLKNYANYFFFVSYRSVRRLKWLKTEDNPNHELIAPNGMGIFLSPHLVCQLSPISFPQSTFSHWKREFRVFLVHFWFCLLVRHRPAFQLSFSFIIMSWIYYDCCCSILDCFPHFCPVLFVVLSWTFKKHRLGFLAIFTFSTNFSLWWTLE